MANTLWFDPLSTSVSLEPTRSGEAGVVAGGAGCAGDGGGVAAQVAKPEMVDDELVPSPVSDATTVAEKETKQLRVPCQMSPVRSCSEEPSPPKDQDIRYLEILYSTYMIFVINIIIN